MQARNAIIDGPFAETKETVAGLYRIDASDVNEAIQIASKIPPAQVGCVEVRPIREPDGRNHDGRTHARRSNEASAPPLDCFIVQ